LARPPFLICTAAPCSVWIEIDEFLYNVGTTETVPIIYPQRLEAIAECLSIVVCRTSSNSVQGSIKLWSMVDRSSDLHQHPRARGRRP
jgi:hypothetical protein